MSDCCDVASYQLFFDAKVAQRRLRRYREEGLDPLARSMVDYLATRDIAGKQLLEIGGGIGDLQVELLRAGVDTAVNIELSSGYEELATQLMAAEGVEDRIDRRLGDFVEQGDEIDPADIVVLNRVVCCYPWMESMMRAAAAKTRRFLALAFPRETWWMKVAIGVENSWLAIRRCSCKAYIHPVEDIEVIAAEDGFEVEFRDRTLGWQAVVFERAAREGTPS